MSFVKLTHSNINRLNSVVNHPPFTPRYRPSADRKLWLALALLTTSFKACPRETLQVQRLEQTNKKQELTKRKVSSSSSEAVFLSLSRSPQSHSGPQRYCGEAPSGERGLNGRLLLRLAPQVFCFFFFQTAVKEPGGADLWSDSGSIVLIHVYTSEMSSTDSG